MQRLQSILNTSQGSDSDQGTSGQSSTVNRGGRPHNWFRKTHFSDSDADVKHNRKCVKCKHCSVDVPSRVELLQRHCLKECKRIAPELRRECETQIVGSTVPAKRPISGLSRSALKQQVEDVGQYMHPKVPRQQQAVLNRKMFMLFCMNGIPFNVADSPYFLDFILSLNQSFKPAGILFPPEYLVWERQGEKEQLTSHREYVHLPTQVQQRCAPPCCSRRACQSRLKYWPSWRGSRTLL